MTITLSSPQAFLTSLVGLAPAKTRHVDPGLALQRLNYVEGRTLTETAIETEQAWVEAQMGVAGRRLTPGIVAGLSIGIANQTEARGSFTLSPGRGITPGGQDVQVLKAASFRLDDLPDVSSSGGTPRGLVVPVLQPLVVETERLPQDASRLFAFADTCPPDGSTAPYLDFVAQDAARIGWVALDPALAGADPARAPNVAAEAIRTIEERDRGALPWAAVGVPLTLFSVAADGTIEWQHRAAVSRRGGMLPRPEMRPLARLRQSRVEGLIEETTMATRRNGWNGTNAAAFLRFVPPAGLLPRKAWTGHAFFPESWKEAEAPIPQSQLDAALDAAAALAPFDLSVAGDKVKWLIPVPDQFYAPDLLIPVTDPDFASVTTLLQGRIADTLALRSEYRVQAQQVQGTLDISAISDFTVVVDDPVENENGFPVVHPATATDFAADAIATLTKIHAGLDPVLFLATQRAMLDPALMQQALAAKGTPFGLTPFIISMRALIDASNDRIDFVFNRVQAEIYRVRQITLDNEEATKLATFPALAGLAKGNNNYALSAGLKSHLAVAKKVVTAAAAPPPPPPPGGAGPAPTATPVAGTPVRFATGATRVRSSAVLAPESNTLETTVSDTRAAPVRVSQPIGLESTVATTGTTSEILFTGAKASTALTGFGNNSASLSFGALVTDASILKSQNATLVKDLVDATRAELVDDVILSDATSKKTGILRAVPLPGDIRDVRTTTIADRLRTSAALNAKASAVRIKADVLRQIQALGISLEGLQGPLTSGRDRVLLPKDDIDKVIASTLTPAEIDRLKSQIDGLRRPVSDTGDSRPWEMMALPEAQLDADTLAVQPLTRLSMALLRRNGPVSMPLLPALTLTKVLDPDPTAGGSDADGDDESAYLSAAITTLESAIAILRVVEARVGAITAAVEAVEAQLKRIAGIAEGWQSALTMADQDLDEARHDLKVAESLIDEETQRLAALRTERKRILDEEVKFVAYTRPRALESHKAGDTLGLMLPGAFEDPLPASLSRDVALPAELADMIATLREMPLLWFASNPELAGEFSSPIYLSTLYSGVKFRAETRLKRLDTAELNRVEAMASASAKLQSVKIASAYRALAVNVLTARATLDLKAFDAASWADKQRRALADLSLNDLIESGSQPKVSKRAAAEIEDIERVAHAMLQLVRQIPAAIRLLWVQRLSAYDDAPSLSRLNRLPAWNRIDFATASRLERLNAWLFSRMENGLREAEALMTDLVRVVILIASHAPVAEIIAARIAAEQAVSTGAAVDLVIRRGVPRIGMQVAFSATHSVQARGIVRDLYGTKAKVEITYVSQPLVSLTPLHQVAVFAPSALARIGR